MLCCTLGRRIGLGTGRKSSSKKIAQCNGDADVGTDLDCLDLLEVPLGD